MESTSRFGLPLLVTGQGQKDITHNEALVLVDALISCVVERRDVALPPHAPLAGTCWLVPEGAAAEWDGKGGQIAVATGGGWRFLVAPEGATLFVRLGRERLRRLDGEWVPDVASGTPAAPIADPAGGAVVDSEARAALAAILDRLRTLGVLMPS